MADRRQLIADLIVGVATGSDAVVVMIERDHAGAPERLLMRSHPITAETAQDVAEFVLEQAIGLTERAGDKAAEAALPHLRDALRSLQAVSAAVDLTAAPIGRA